jgi:hypothetical protein
MNKDASRGPIVGAMSQYANAAVATLNVAMR